MDLSAPAILKKLEAFRKTEWFNVLLVIVLGLVAVGLFQFTTIGGIGVCLGIILPPVTVFVIPYWLGERRMKRLALYIVPVLVIALILIAALQTQAVVGQGKPNLSSGVDPATPAARLPAITLWNGTVDPFNAPSANATYAFHVRLKQGPGANLSRASVYLNMSELAGLSDNLLSPIPMVKDSSRNATNGTWYVAWRPLDTNVYAFQFFASDGRGNQTFSSPVLAPVLAPWSNFYGIWLVSIGEFMIYPASFYFVILFMYWYTIRTRRLRERMIQARGEKLDLKKEGAKEGEVAVKDATAKPPAPTREKSRKVAAFTCTNCGADVTDADTKCPKCGAVFED
ncbi:MAG TPA: zinc ribbon domain-containing protein [Thermoplasmata archaeon]|nr:zinc ribbon domain-containing protein [Thermoplasmata archaeon]